MDKRANPNTNDQPVYASAQQNFANATPMQIAKRDLQEQLTDKRFWIGLAAVVVILTIAGPFGTGDDLAWPALLGYWAITAFATYVVCLVCSVWLAAQLMDWGATRSVAQLLAAIPAGIAAFAVVIIINLAISFTNPPDSLRLLAQCIGVCMAINVVFLAFDSGTDAPSIPPVTSNLVLDKIAPDKRGAILHIETQDHYLNVTTTKGTDLILMRLGDAVAALGDQGMQTHRSHWVAASAVSGSERQNNRWVLILKNGTVVPVSRPYVQSLRAKGLLPSAR